MLQISLFDFNNTNIWILFISIKTNFTTSSFSFNTRPTFSQALTQLCPHPRRPFLHSHQGAVIESYTPFHSFQMRIFSDQNQSQTRGIKYLLFAKYRCPSSWKNTSAPKINIKAIAVFNSITTFAKFVPSQTVLWPHQFPKFPLSSVVQ